MPKNKENNPIGNKPHDHVASAINVLLAQNWDKLTSIADEGTTKVSIGLTIDFDSAGLINFGIRMSYARREKVTYEGTFDPNQPELPIGVSIQDREFTD